MPIQQDRSSEQRFTLWMQRYHNATMIRHARVLPLRRDMMTLLKFVRDNKVVGTRSTGNMPLKAVRQVTADFVDPPELDTTIGERTFRLRTEANVWPLYFLHILADVGGLLSIAPGRLWRFTPQTKDFLKTSPLLQVSHLLTIWWYGVNWLVAYSVIGMGDALPPSFNRVVLALLLDLPVEAPILFEPFADRIIEKSGLAWSRPDAENATDSLRHSIKKMVIEILSDFGAVEQTLREKLVSGFTFYDLYAFEVKPFGQALLDALTLF